MSIVVLCPSRNNPQALAEAAETCRQTRSYLTTQFVAVLDEGPDEAQGRRLHAAVKDEWPGDDEELHAARSRR